MSPRIRRSLPVPTTSPITAGVLVALRRLTVVALLLTVASGPQAWAQSDSPVGDVFDQFFRHTDKENRAVFQEMPGETVDPFTGTLSIVQEDLLLPGKAGLDLRVQRTYSSKIWGRADLLDMEPLLAEKETSVLGYGWSMHMGRLRNPYAIPPWMGCGGEFPVYEAPDGSSQVFYPVPGSNSVFSSREYWRLELNCTIGARQLGACVWSSTGVRYEFDTASQFFQGTVPVWPVSRIVDPVGNHIDVAYQGPAGAVTAITDTYNRTVTFAYDDDVDGTRLASMTANGHVYRYFYTWYGGASQVVAPGGLRLPGARRFLTEVKPPEGPSYLYDYAFTSAVAQNECALSAITYPSGGTTAFAYDARPFFTGRETVPFSVVTRRVVMTPSRYGSVSGEWDYEYNSPGPDCELSQTCPKEPETGLLTDLHVTTVTRPDLLQDTYTIIGFGFVAKEATATARYAYGVGRPFEIARANRTFAEKFHWSHGEPISNAPFNAPAYSGNCGPYWVYDSNVVVPRIDKRWVLRDRAGFHTEYSDFDAYDQARTVAETSQLGSFDTPVEESRSTTWTYLSVPVAGDGTTLNIVRGKPLTRRTCVRGECVADSWTYRARGYLKDTETTSGVTTTYGYGADGTLASVTNLLGQSLGLGGYENGVPTSIDFNGAFTMMRTVSWEGWIKTETNGRGRTTSYEYDGTGRLTSVTPPGNNLATSWTYAADGRSFRMERGGYWKDSYLDGFGRVEFTQDAVGIQTSARYDAMGRKWFESYPGDAATGEVGRKFALDGLGRVTLETQAYRPTTDACETPGACQIWTSYLANCVQQAIERATNDATYPGQCFTSFGNPEEQRLSQVADGNGSIWRYGYNASGKLTTITAPLAQGNRTNTYDANQFLSSETTAESGTVTYDRNAIGQMTGRTDARPVAAAYDYTDPLGRLHRATYQGGSDEDVVREYEAHLLWKVTSTNGGIYEYGYDDLDRVATQTWTTGAQLGGGVYTTSYGFDSVGCLTSITYPTGGKLTLTCDAANRTKTITLNGAAIVTDVVYHPSGQPKTVVYGNGVTTTLDYDDRGRLKRALASGLVDLQYGYDGANNVTSFQDALVQGSARTMWYDALDRIWAADGPWGYARYNYDGLGNRTSKSIAGVQSTYGYDAQTNRLDGVEGSARFVPMTFTWDLAGRLATSSDGTTYLYDGHGRRVLKANALKTVYHYDAAGRVLAETLPDGTKLREYVYLGNRLVAVDGCMDAAASSSCTDRQWYHTDALGSPVARTDTAGQVVARFEYQPWGEAWAQSGVPGDRQYNGRVYDAGTGFHDYGARMYWPEIGRFISADSYLGDPANPASLNRYSYVHNNPYRYVDPGGHTPAIPLWLAKFLAGSEALWAEAAVAARSFTAGGAIGLLITPAQTASGDDAYNGNIVYSSSPTLPPRRIAEGGDVLVEHNYRSNDHPPAHAHVTGGGETTRIGPNGHPLAGDPELSTAQKKVVEQNRGPIRKALNKVGRWLERQEREQQSQPQPQEKK